MFIMTILLKSERKNIIKGYDDFGKGIKIVYFPLKQLISCKNERRQMNDRSRRYNWGKQLPADLYGSKTVTRY